MSAIILFDTAKTVPHLENAEALGSRGNRAVSLAGLGVPVCPGIVIPSDALGEFPDDTSADWDQLKPGVDNIEAVTKKKYADEKNPLLLKVVESPILNVRSSLPSVHHVGLCDSTVQGFGAQAGETFAWQEYAFLVSTLLKMKIEVDADDSAWCKKAEAFRGKLKNATKKAAIQKLLAEQDGLLPADVFTDPYFQISWVIKLFREAYKLSPTRSDSAVMIQSMVYGNLDDKSASGYFYSHNIITGEDSLQGEFFPRAFDETANNGKILTGLEKKYYKELERIGRILEDHYRDLRWVRFAIESGTLWLVDQSATPNKSTQAEIKTLLDLHKRKIVEADFVIDAIKPGRLSEILHPTLDRGSVKGMPKLSGGIAGSVGAAIGRVYFNAERLVTAFREAQQAGEDTNMILAMPATFAGDVKGIEIAQGVLSSEGGYASHAPVVARSLGKVALVRPDVQFKAKSMKIDNQEVKEGDYITLQVPYYEDPEIFIGKGSLTKPTPEGSGLLELLEIIQSRIGIFDVHANADQPRDAALALKFGAHGIGLCRTEHMFFDENRIDRFRYMILADSIEMRQKALDDLQVDQTKDFYELLKIMDGYPVTIRLLDAPLHEFLPSTREQMDVFVKKAQTDKTGLTRSTILSQAQLLREFNPMLGHRGIRVAISYPEIYRMQIHAIFEASYKLKKEGKDPRPEIMIPLVMTPNELKIIRNGKRIEGKQILGIRDMEAEVRAKFKLEPLDYKVGTMIELPAAALDAGEIARYADFFSFGTNDLTQTTYGISRDDFNTFYSDYSELDILPSNPFKVLQPQVRELVQIATLRGRMVRPDLTAGLCGEHGAEPANIDFLEESGLNYVSVSPYGIPIAKLAIAQMNIKRGS